MVTGWLVWLFSAIVVGPESEPLLEFGFEVVVQVPGFYDNGVGASGSARRVGIGAVVRGNNGDEGRVFELLQAARGLSAVEMREMQVHEGCEDGFRDERHA